MTERSADELLDGVRVRDFVVLAMRARGSDPGSVRNLLRLRRGRWYVKRAERRLRERGLLVAGGSAPVPSADGMRALRTGAALVALEAFDPEL
jgi:hypothetical protein